MHVVGFIIRIYHDAWLPERQITKNMSTLKQDDIVEGRPEQGLPVIHCTRYLIQVQLVVVFLVFCSLVTPFFYCGMKRQFCNDGV